MEQSQKEIFTSKDCTRSAQSVTICTDSNGINGGQELASRVVLFDQGGHGLDNGCASRFDFSLLPRLVFLHILRYFQAVELCQMCLVSKVWHKTCLDSTLWRNLDFRKFENMRDETLVRLTAVSDNVTSLKVTGCFLTNAGMVTVIARCATLLELCVYRTECLTDEVLEAIGRYCKNLRKLDISACQGFSDAGVKKVCEGCLVLEEVTTDECLNLSDNTLVYLGEYCTNLKTLSVAHLNITDEGVGSLLQRSLHLRSLCVPFCKLSRQTFLYIVEYCPDICRFDVRGMTLEDQDVCELVQTCTRLQVLNLSLCFNLTDTTLLEVGLKCKELRYLFLVRTDITDEGLTHLSKYCKSLEHLDVSWCNRVTAVGAENVLNGCPKLKLLALVRCGPISNEVLDSFSVMFPAVYISSFNTEMKKMFPPLPQPTEIQK